LAKRLQVPSRALSLAINQVKGMNVSQYVNDFRLDHAAKLLAEGQGSVAEVMDQSGFLTRSNFYREFQRRFDMTPAAYRDVAKRGQSGI
jgi:AraC-like DNA-binding protein